MSDGDYAIRFFLALLLVFGLLGLMAFCLRRFGAIKGRQDTQKRLGIVETVFLDPKRRLVLIRRDQVEHLLLIGGPSDLVIETTIAPTPSFADHIQAGQP